MNLSEKIQAIIDAPDDDFASLLKIAGFDPATDLRHANWEGADFGAADIAGWDFTGACLNRADLSKVQNIEKAFFNRDCGYGETEFVGTILPDGVAVEQLMKQG